MAQNLKPKTENYLPIFFSKLWFSFFKTVLHSTKTSMRTGGMKFQSALSRAIFPLDFFIISASVLFAALWGQTNSGEAYLPLSLNLYFHWINIYLGLISESFLSFKKCAKSYPKIREDDQDSNFHSLEDRAKVKNYMITCDSTKF